ncbi:MAG: hypothetical protein RMY34_22865 [Aulosira sp. DedQUE10]|nr:hypothetical protein [Aulosira sp. DedQUE10]
MANRLRKQMPKPSGDNQPVVGAIKHLSQKNQKNSQQGNWLTSTLAIAILLSSGGILMTFAWISILFIFNPEQIIWMNKFLPEWAQISRGNYKDKPFTLKQIQLSLSQQKRIAGETLVLAKDKEQSFLLPVFQQRPNCLSDCQSLVELRVYQQSQDLELQSQTEKYYRLTSQIPVTGPEESFVVSTSDEVELENPETSQPLPLNEVKRLSGGTSSGVWFDLQGKLPQGSSAIAYGNIVYYNPERSNLQQMLSWKSRNGQVPKWEQVTGDAVKELIIDQTIGLEPRLRIYQVKPLKLFLHPIQLEEISLKTPALKDTAYQNALLLARSGLWTPAFEWLQSFQKQQKAALPLAAQAQIDVIRLHSQLTKTEADKTWAIPSQEVLADLIDGRWNKALQVFEASPQNIPEIATLLQMDGGRLWNRITTALRVNPNRPEVAAWGALILAVQRGEEHAISWLKAQPKITPETLTYIEGLLAKLSNEGIRPKIISSQPSRIVGSVEAITQVIKTEWLRPNPTVDLQLTDNEVWYQVEVSAFNDGKRWLNFPFGNFQLPKISPAKFLWDTLGISADPAILIVVWLPNGEQQMTTATIKGVQLQGGVLRLLVAGQPIANNQNKLQPRPLALTDAALEWVQPSPITLEELYQQDSARVTAMLPTVWKSIQQSGQIPHGMPSIQQMLQQIGYWPVQVINLTNNPQPETVLTISAEAIASLKQSGNAAPEDENNLSRPRTLILSDNGKLIYTEFQQNYHQTLTAIAQLSDGQSLALLIENGDKYSLKRWSKKNQRFE